MNNIVQPEGTNACGAFALMACLAAHHRLENNEPYHLEHRSAHIIPENIQVTLEIKANPQVNNALAKNLYGITAEMVNIFGINLENNNISHIDTVAQINGQNRNTVINYNTPSAIVDVALQMGIASATLNLSTHGYQFLVEQLCENVVNNEINFINNLEYGHVNRDINYYNAPAGQETQMILVANNAGGLHWLARASNGAYYDPANGNQHIWRNPENDNQKVKIGNYSWLGLWIVFTNR
jgi:hypothetical protein